MTPMFYFLLSLTAVLAATVNSQLSPYVLDTNGNAVEFNRSYLVITDYGGLTLSSRGDKQCPFYVQTLSSDGGIPIRFSNAVGVVDRVPVFSNLLIEMDIKDTYCNQSTYWWVTESQSDKWPFIAVGPPQTGKDVWRSYFMVIERSARGGLIDYEIINIHYPGKGNVGTLNETGIRRLAVGTAQPLSQLCLRDLPR